MVVVSSLESFGMALGGGGGGACVTVKLSAEPWRKASRVAWESDSGALRSLLLPPKSLPMRRPLLELLPSSTTSFSMVWSRGAGKPQRRAVADDASPATPERACSCDVSSGVLGSEPSVQESSRLVGLGPKVENKGSGMG